MKTDKMTVFDLFQTHRRYVVPIFQRGYVWTREKQWQPLWDDLISQASECTRHKKSADSRLHKHFLGAMVLNLSHTALSQVPVVEVIDGQQRLMTLQVLLAALKDETAFIENPYLKADLERLTTNRGPLANPDEIYKVWPTSALQDHVRNVMDAGSSNELVDRYKGLHKFRYKRWEPPRPGLMEAYLFFASAVKNFLSKDDEDLPLELLSLPAAKRAEVLIEALIWNIQMVTIELEADDDAQVIFETLNARGEPLTPSDLVRNFIFLTAARQDLDVSQLYSEQWRQFEEEPPHQPFWKQEERQGRIKRSRMDLFLFHYVTFKTGEELKIGHLYQVFKDWWELSQDREIGGELDELLRYSQFYRQLLEPDISTHFGRFSQHMRALDTTTAYPLVLWIAGEIGSETPEFIAMLDDIESFVVRRAVCGYNQKAYNRLFLEFLNRLKEDGVPPSRSALSSLLASSNAPSAIWPPDDAFRRSLIGDPMYRTLRPRRTQMILETLEYASRSPFAEKIEVKSPLTVEHVLPQSASDSDWPLECKPNESESEARQRRSMILHTLGNLTLLTQPLNSSESNGPYSKKRPAIAKQSLLALNSYFQDAKDWGEAEILKRGEKLADLAVVIWPSPKTLGNL